ncbi:hypothetical protein [Polaribacter butkevichii]|uniref:hypothetical protein n=1 Tax=Polaribacter butkevichii TaxID=218490 RepID=UPI001FEADBF2|nr:hypothetical protein [Polaribacter butkevichii]
MRKAKTTNYRLSFRDSSIKEYSDFLISYYRVPYFGKKENKPSKLTYHESKGWVNQDTVLASIKEVLIHKFIDCGYRLNELLFTKGWLSN